MTISQVEYFAVINHTKINCYKELVYNITTYNDKTFDLISTNEWLVQLVGVNNERKLFDLFIL